ncbi:MAG: ABC transporter substrate-binding protein [Ilumatobacteraceae bacterium]
MGLATDASNLDPVQGNLGSDVQMLLPIFDTLIKLDANTGEPGPGLATKWDYSADGKTLTLTLRQGVKFQDGTPMDAESVRFSLERYRTDAKQPQLQSVDSIEVTGPDTVALHLSKPDITVLGRLADRAGMVTSPTAVQKDAEAFGRAPVGAGPFKLVEWRTGDRIELERFADYWDPSSIHVDKLELRVITDRKAAVNALMSGDIDFADGLDPADYDRLQGDKDLVASAPVGSWLYQLTLDRSNKPLDDPRVRLAMAIAINRDELVKAAADGQGEPGYMSANSSHWAYDPSMAEAFRYDPDRAKQLLAEAGYPDGFKVTVVMPTDTTEVRRNEVIRAQLAKVGIDYELHPMDRSQGVQAFFERREFNIGQYSDPGSAEPAGSYVATWPTTSYSNVGKDAPPGLLEGLDKVLATTDRDERIQAYKDLNEVIKEQVPSIPLYFRANVTAYSTKVGNYQPWSIGVTRVAYMGFVAD